MQQLPKMLEQTYRLRFSETESYRNKVWEILCADFFSQYIPESSVVLDLGAGYGEFVNNIVAAEKYAMDLNPETGQRLSNGILFLQQNCSDQWMVASSSLDVVFTSNFLEHLHDKSEIERTVSEAYRCLKPGGVFLCLCPNIKYAFRNYWDFWDHYTPLSESSCSELLQMTGFSIERCIPRFLPYSMSSGQTPPLFLVKAYFHIPLLWPIFGKQFFIVGRKTLNMDGR